jgi:hypothetical protein
MIIRTAQRRSFTALPNAIFRDKNLQLDSRAGLAYLLTLPPNWDIRPTAVARALSPAKGRKLGKERLRRMFGEWQCAGYMMRSAEQTRDGDGYFGAYVYIVGADPEAVKVEANAQGVAFLPQAALPSTGEPSTGERSTAKPPPYKEIKETNKSNLQTESSEFQYSDAALVEAQHGQQDERKPPSQRRSGKRTETVQHELAQRMGAGDATAGWLFLGGLPDGDLDQLTAQQRNGRLTDQHIAELHLRFPMPGERGAA